jgi:hypothetical protein
MIRPNDTATEIAERLHPRSLSSDTINTLGDERMPNDTNNTIDVTATTTQP